MCIRDRAGSPRTTYAAAQRHPSARRSFNHTAGPTAHFMTDSGTNRRARPISVSYTHLDVYKRQGLASLIIAIGPRVLLGWLAGVLFTLLMKTTKKINVSLILAALISTLTHTALVMLGIYVFFGSAYAAVKGVALSGLAALLLGAVMTKMCIRDSDWSMSKRCRRGSRWAMGRPIRRRKRSGSELCRSVMPTAGFASIRGGNAGLKGKPATLSGGSAWIRR